MASYNKIILVGNLTRDPEVRSTATGVNLTRFGLAVNRKSKAGDETMFIDVTAWRQLGEICAKYLKKGAPVLVEGRLNIRNYDDKEGVKRKSIEVDASDMQMLGSKRDAQEAASIESPPEHGIDDFFAPRNDEIPF
jgi:single-strand DNA-binding protein